MWTAIQISYFTSNRRTKFTAQTEIFCLFSHKQRQHLYLILEQRILRILAEISRDPHLPITHRRNILFMLNAEEKLSCNGGSLFTVEEVTPAETFRVLFVDMNHLQHLYHKEVQHLKSKRCCCWEIEEERTDVSLLLVCQATFCTCAQRSCSFNIDGAVECVLLHRTAGGRPAGSFYSLLYSM